MNAVLAATIAAPASWISFAVLLDAAPRGIKLLTSSGGRRDLGSESSRGYWMAPYLGCSTCDLFAIHLFRDDLGRKSVKY
uniref:Secreted protein n=1 Tax=Oryza brachyantha TaxID=4533 RepID=J3LF27_ORYBR